MAIRPASIADYLFVREMMEEIRLNLNLRFVLAALSISQRGELLGDLLDMEKAQDETVLNLCRYIRLLQPEGYQIVGGECQQNVSEVDVNDTKNKVLKKTVKRKGAKENNINKNNFKFIYGGDNGDVEAECAVPTLEEARAYAAENGLQVNAEEFIDFYESHGWRVGKTPIRNWRATMKLWHRRAKRQENGEDAAYWTELEASVKPEAMLLNAEEAECKESVSERQAFDGDEQVRLSPFAAFIKKLDGKTEGRGDDR